MLSCRKVLKSYLYLRIHVVSTVIKSFFLRFELTYGTMCLLYVEDVPAFLHT